MRLILRVLSSVYAHYRNMQLPENRMRLIRKRKEGCYSIMYVQRGVAGPFRSGGQLRAAAMWDFEGMREGGKVGRRGHVCVKTGGSRRLRRKDRTIPRGCFWRWDAVS
jgi:hypothetical protein